MGVLFLLCPTCWDAWVSFEPQSCSLCEGLPISCSPWSGDIQAWWRARFDRHPERLLAASSRGRSITSADLPVMWVVLTRWNEAPTAIKPWPAEDMTRSFIRPKLEYPPVVA